MKIRAEIIVRAVQVVIQRAFFFGALAVNLAVVVWIRLVVDGRAAAQDQHAVHESVLSAGKIGVERRELLRIDAELLRSCFRPILGSSGHLRNRGDGENA